MGFSEIKENLRNLSEKERRELVACIVQIEEEREDSYIERITQEIDDTKGFVRWNEVKSEFLED